MIQLERTKIQTLTKAKWKWRWSHNAYDGHLLMHENVVWVSKIGNETTRNSP
jgi:hypothetical protein